MKLVLVLVACLLAFAGGEVRGKVSSVVDSVNAAENRSFTYDPNGRLVSSTGPWGAGSYVYDPGSSPGQAALGNIRTRNDGTQTAAIGYDSLKNRVASATVNGVARAYAYDGRGNVTSNGLTGFAYDFANQPTALTGTGAASYSYDANLKRVKAVAGGKTVYTVYSRVTGGLVYRDEASDAKKTDYVSAGGAALRLKKIGTGAASPEYTHFDGQGTALAATDAAGAILWRERYTPFGKGSQTVGAAGANLNNTGFTGHLEDDVSGLVYMQARYYDPLVPRFLSTDPVGYQDQLNLYAYVANDPVNATDPTGEFLNILAGAVGGAIVGAAIEATVQVATGKGSLKERLNGGAIARAAAVGAATGAVGPAGGAALRAALVGKGVASASKAAAAIPSGKALVAVTDTAADLVGQPAIGAIDAALKGDDPGAGAVGGVGAAGTGAAFDVAAGIGESKSPGVAGAKGAAVAAAKAIGTNILKSAVTSGGAEAAKQAEPIDPDKERR